MKKILPFLAALATVPPTVVTTAASVNYVIIGGGPAGFVLLEQLTRNPNVKVTLIEAGPDGSSNSALNSKLVLIHVSRGCQR